MNNPLCKYKDIFGKPDTGIHRTRFLGVAVADVIMTIIGAVVFAWAFRLSYVYTIVGFFLFGIVVHRVFCVRTTVDKLLFYAFGHSKRRP